MKHVVPVPLFIQPPQRCLGQDGHADWQTTIIKRKGWIVFLAPVALNAAGQAEHRQQRLWELAARGHD
jgi:hypothetical protein